MPTVDTQRNKFVVGSLVRCGHHALVVGGVGVGKTMTLQSLLEGLPSDKTYCTINFSAQTSSNSLQVGWSFWGTRVVDLGNCGQALPTLQGTTCLMASWTLCKWARCFSCSRRSSVCFRYPAFALVHCAC